jgi:hypothetical protein
VEQIAANNHTWQNEKKNEQWSRKLKIATMMATKAGMN